MIEVRIDNRPRSGCDVHGLAVIPLGLRSEDAAIRRKSEALRRQKLRDVQITAMKFRFVGKSFGESNAQSSIRSCFKGQLSDLAQISLRRFRAVMFSVTFEGRVAAMKRMPHHEIKKPIRQFRQPAAGRLHKWRSSETNALR